MPSENDYARKGFIPLGPANRKKPTVGKASRALHRGGRDLSDLTGDPADQDFMPEKSEAQKRLKKRFGGF
jgi:hypothetical protein